jgi:hypothetical protein
VHACDISSISCLDRPILGHSFLRRGAAQTRSATFPCKTPGRRGIRRCKTEVLKNSIIRETPALLPLLVPGQSRTVRKERWAGLVGAVGKLAVLCCRGHFFRALVFSLQAPTAEVTNGNTPTFVYAQCGVPEPGAQDPRSWVACVVGKSSL